jgi:hypothetical protein
MCKNTITPPIESVDDAKEMYRNEPAFHRFVNGLISLMKDNILTPEQITTGCILAVGEFEFHIESQLKQNG